MNKISENVKIDSRLDLQIPSRILQSNEFTVLATRMERICRSVQKIYLPESKISVLAAENSATETPAFGGGG